MAKVITEQGIFDFVYKFIIKQGRPSKNGWTCEYRMTTCEGKILACSAGCLLSDEEAALLDNSFWEDVVSSGRAPERFLPFTDLIRALQKAHDYAADYLKIDKFMEHFKNNMRNVANTFGLKVPEVP